MVWDLNLKRKLSELSWNSPGEILQINSREIKVNSKTEEKFVIMVSWDESTSSATSATSRW